MKEEVHDETAGRRSALAANADGVAFVSCLSRTPLLEVPASLTLVSRSLTVPVRHRIDVTSGLILLDLSGSVTRAEMFAYYAALLADPDLRPGLAVLADCRRVTSSPSFIELHAVANAQAQLPQYVRPTRAAVLVNKGWLYGIIRQFAAMIERRGIRVMPFVDDDEARRWLAASDARAMRPVPDSLVGAVHSDSNNGDRPTEIA